MAIKAKKIVSVWDYDLSHLSATKQAVLWDILDEIGELERQVENGTATPNGIKSTRLTLENEFREIYFKTVTPIETILAELQANDFHAELMHFIIECNGLNELALRNAYKIYMNSEPKFRMKYSFFKFYFFTICVNGLYDIDGNRVNPETGFEYRGPYNMRFPSSLLKQWELGASIKNPVLTIHGLKRYSKKELYENYGFQLNNGMVLQ